MRHLSDQELQGYLDGESSIDRFEIETHLQNCGFCQRNLAAYKQLFSGLKSDTGFMLSANFSESVIAKIEGNSESKFDYFEIGLLILAGIAGVGLLFYFTNLGQYFMEIFTATNISLATLVNQIPFLSGGKLQLFGFAAIILTLFGFLDRLIVQMKHR